MLTDGIFPTIRMGALQTSRSLMVDFKIDINQFKIQIKHHGNIYIAQSCGHNGHVSCAPS